MSDLQTEGQTQDPGLGSEVEMTEDGGGTGGELRNQFEDLNARYDLLNDTVAELRDAIVRTNSQRQAPPQMEIDDDDGELTASKVKRIVSNSLGQAMNKTQADNQRTTWDQKAKEDFPLSDPKFLRAFKQEWNDMTSDGALDPNHPRAIYKIAKIVAKGWKTGDKSGASQDIPTSEAPTANPSGNRTSTRKAAITDDDPRVKFFMMRGKKSDKQLSEFKEKLASRDAKGGGKRR